MFGLSNREEIVFLNGVIVVAFALFARFDFVFIARECFDGVLYGLGPISVNPQWFWMWFVGIPCFGFCVAIFYYGGANETERSLTHAVGLFVTVILWGVGMLEDFFWPYVNPEIGSQLGLFESWEPWGWSSENNFWWKILDTLGLGPFMTIHHYLIFGVTCCLVVGLWYYLLWRREY